MVKENLITIADFIPFTLPAAMYFFGQSNDILTIFKLWMIIICTSSFLFTITGIHAGHHHPLAFHDGDIARSVLLINYNGKEEINNIHKTETI